MSEINVEIVHENIPVVEIIIDENSAQTAKDAAEEAKNAVAGNAIIPFLELRIIAEGSQDGVPNVAKTFEPGNTVEGFKDANTYWESAMYEGGDPEERASYTPMVEVIWEEIPDTPDPDPDPVPDANAPLIITGDATGVTQDSFTLSATPTQMGTGTGWIQSGIEVDINPDFSNYVTQSSPTLSALAAFSVTFNNPLYAWGNLVPNTTYYYRAKMIVNPAYEGEIFFYGETKTVTTLP